MSTSTSDQSTSSLQADEPEVGDIEKLIVELENIRQRVFDAPALHPNGLQRLHPNHVYSGKNLMHYLALRQHDLRHLQRQLDALGLSSFGHSESHALATLDAVLRTLYRLTQHPLKEKEKTPLDFESGNRILAQNVENLLGKKPPERDTHIMVTMPSAAAFDYSLVESLLRQGMDCMRINCAHDSPDVWQQMITNLRQAEKKLGIPCKVSMDLAGPKLRTGPLPAGPAVVRIKPQRDNWGRITRPARILLTASPDGINTTADTDLSLAVAPAVLATIALGDIIYFRDSREANRQLLVTDKPDTGCLVELYKTAYIATDTQFICRRDNHTLYEFQLAYLPPNEGVITLSPGDNLILSPHEEIRQPGEVGCTLPEVLAHINVGEDVWFDDGKIGGVVEQIIDQKLHIRITQTGGKPAKLHSDKGINFPSSQLQLPALTDKDLSDLAFVAQHADIVALSFANSVADVRALCEQLRGYGREDISIILKIETVTGFNCLPAMLLEAMAKVSCGIMIARGDLAIETGFERLAEVQEEILWLCEAAQVPVIWATQVLENLAKNGAPTRAEITDAAMGHRADCVMLNKGPFILNAVKALDNILCRMQSHQVKKQAMLRELHLSQLFFRRLEDPVDVS